MSNMADPFGEDLTQLQNKELSEGEKSLLDAQATHLQGRVDMANAQIEGGQMTTDGQQPTGEQPSGESQDQQWPWEEGADFGDAVRTISEGAMAAPAGLADFGVDIINIIPGVEIPKLPKFQNEAMQTFREISSIVTPNLLVAGRVASALKGVAAARKWGIAQNAVVKFGGKAAVYAGTGAAVDAINKLSETDDNLMGTLKKTFPKTFHWISDDWATVDGEAPDVKRMKNIMEGVGLGLFTDLFEGVGKLLKLTRGSTKATKYLPGNESSQEYFSKVTKETADSPEEVVANSIVRREDALDEIGRYNLSKETDLDKPLLGVHDVFDLDEAGTRSVDEMGVIGASVDAVRINKNLDTVYGRLGSVVSEAALKYGLEAGELPKRTIVKAIADQIKGASKYSAELASGAKVTFDEIDEAGSRLHEILMDPRMEPGLMRATLDEFKDEYDKLGEKVRSLGDVGYNAAMKTIKGLLDEYLNMDVMKAQGYFTTSLAGQVADMAEGARLMDGTAAVARAQDMILDRVEYLMVEKGLAAYNKGSSLNFLNTWKRLRDDPKGLRAAAQAQKDATDEAVSSVVERARTFSETMRTISKERPEFLKPLAMAYEYTDGDVNTMSRLNNFFDQSLNRIDKAFYDGQPEIPNQIVQGAWANIYNSVLTSISTPLKAGFGNSVLMLTKPMSVFAGAAMARDMKTLKRGWYQYSAFMDTFQKGLSHMNQVFRKASSDPTSVGYIVRDDIAVKNEQTMELLKEYATAAEARGESGPLALYNIAETLHDVSNNPVLRFGANAMTALDGFTRAVMANAEARGRAFDQFVDGGQELTEGSLKRVSDELYDSMFDKSGMITDKAVDYASREIALNLDNPSVTAISQFIDRNKFMKPFLMFPRTSANMISMTNKFSPVSLFMKDYNRLAMPGNNFSKDEIVEILTSKGLEVSEQNFRNLRAEIRGRKAIGTMTIMSAGWLFMNDRLHGNGHFDKERQRVRQQLNWKPRSYMGWDGNWYSYDGLGPLSDFLALTADVMDNFDSISENDLETTLNKLGFLLSANLTNKSMLAGLEPMNDVLSGNPAALNRWAASFASSLMPLSGFRNELGRILSPQLRELDMEFGQLLRNRNKFVDLLDPKNALPNAYDWIDGKPIGYSDNFFVRGWNAIMPMKVSDGISAERQFLIDIEYDSRPTFRTNGRGVEYTPSERSELFSIIGKQGYLKRELSRIMKTKDAKAWREQIKRERAGGATVDPKQWGSLYRQLNQVMRNARNLAQNELSNRDEIRRREFEQKANVVDQRRSETPRFPLVNK